MSVLVRVFTGLHRVAFLGVVEIISIVLEMEEWDVNATDCMGVLLSHGQLGKGTRRL